MSATLENLQVDKVLPPRSLTILTIGALDSSESFCTGCFQSIAWLENALNSRFRYDYYDLAEDREPDGAFPSVYISNTLGEMTVVASVPEPSASWLGFVGLGFVRRKKARRIQRTPGSTGRHSRSTQMLQKVRRSQVE